MVGTFLPSNDGLSKANASARCSSLSDHRIEARLGTVWWLQQTANTNQQQTIHFQQAVGYQGEQFQDLAMLMDAGAICCLFIGQKKQEICPRAMLLNVS